jgi:hypothetical protein
MTFQEVDANNEDISHLIEKIINLSQVVFEELMACHKAGYYYLTSKTIYWNSKRLSIVSNARIRI